MPMNDSPEGQARPRWHMVKERIRKEDGRYLIYYRFLAGEEASPSSLLPENKQTAPATLTSFPQERS